MHYDEDCLDICRPFSEPYTNAKYELLTCDSAKVDQIATILIRFKKLDPTCMEDLIFVIPRIEPYDFTKFRDHEVSLRSLRNKILGIPDDYIVRLEDIEARVD